MSKVAVVYWSGSGNTLAMAEAVLEGAKSSGAEAELIQAGEFGPEKVSGYTGIAFGCRKRRHRTLHGVRFRT